MWNFIYCLSVLSILNCAGKIVDTYEPYYTYWTLVVHDSNSRIIWIRFIALLEPCTRMQLYLSYSTFFSLAFDFCRFCVVIPFLIPATTANDLRRIFYTRFYPLHLFSYLNSWERASIFPFWMYSAKQGHYWYHFYNVFSMTRSLTRDWTRDLPHSKLALYH